MKIDVLIYVVIAVLFIAFFSYKWFVKKEKQWCKDTLYNIQRMVEDYFGTKAGQAKLKTTLEKINGIIDTRCSKLSVFSKWLLKRTLNEFVIKNLIEDNMPQINAYGAERKEKELVKSAVDFGIKKGISLLTDEVKEHTETSNVLLSAADKLNLQAEDNAYITAYAEFRDNFKNDKEIRAGVLGGVKF